jgi:hypothetical protein
MLSVLAHSRQDTGTVCDLSQGDALQRPQCAHDAASASDGGEMAPENFDGKNLLNDPKFAELLLGAA